MPKESESKRTKRDHGDGSITKRNDGSWTARIMIGTQSNGKPKIKAFYGKSEAEVKRKLKEFKKQIDQLPKSEIGKQSLSEYMNYWLTVYKSNEIKPSSYDILEYIFEKYIKPNIGFLQLRNVSSDDIQQLLNKMKNNGLSHSTIGKVYKALNACYKHAVIKEDIKKNPLTAVKMPSVSSFPSKDIVFLLPDEIESFYNEAIRKYSTGKFIYRMGYGLILILYTGMRTGEALALRWKDVNIENKTITVRNTIYLVRNRGEGKKYVLHEGTAKSDASSRLIPLNKRALEAIEYLKKINGNSELVMANSKGEPLSHRNLFRMAMCIKEVAKIDKLTLHALRHTFASMLFAKGVDLKTVSELLGHVEIGITAKTYVHLLQENKAKAVALLD